MAAANQKARSVSSASASWAARSRTICSRRLARRRLRHRRGALPGAGARRRRDRRRRRRRCRRGADHHHQPAEAGGADATVAGDRRCRRAAHDRRRMLAPSRSRTSTAAEQRAAQGRPRHARLSDQRHRLAGQDQGPRDLRQRRQRGDRQAASRCSPASRARRYDLGAFGNGSRMKYVANLLVAINNVARPKPWCSA